MNRLSRPALLAALGLSLALGGCKFRKEGPAQTGAASPEAGQVARSTAISSPTPTASPATAQMGPRGLPSPSASQAPAASIIRGDIRADKKKPAVQPLNVIVPFGDNGNDLGPQAKEVLGEVLQSPALAQGWPITLRGHTDAGGNYQANMRVSRARAEAVAAWLIDHGVADSRITVIAFGEQNPIAPNANPDGTPDLAGRRKNRRVEIEIAPSGVPSKPPGSATADQAGPGTADAVKGA